MRISAPQPIEGNHPTNFVDGANVGMILSRSGAGFPAEAFQNLRISGHIWWQELQSYEAAKVCVLSFVNDTHPTATHSLYDAIVRDGLADHWRESYV